MKRLAKVIAMIGLMASVGCSTTLNKSQPSSSINFSVQSDMAADVDVDINTVLKGQAREAVLFGFIPLKSSKTYLDGVMYGGGEGGGFFEDSVVARAKAAAAYDALKKAGDVDVLVGARYVIQKKSVWIPGIYKEVAVSVTGYAGRIKRIKNSNK